MIILKPSRRLLLGGVTAALSTAALAASNITPAQETVSKRRL